MGADGSNRRKRCHSVYATGAIAIGVPGWPELAFWIASIDSVRIVLMQSWSRSCATAEDPSPQGSIRVTEPSPSLTTQTAVTPTAIALGPGPTAIGAPSGSPDG